ncbi:MAG TPA: hypothetical protein PK360_06400, partial [bacterium]|nr:hypothetical protein [bacterium]
MEEGKKRRHHSPKEIQQRFAGLRYDYLPVCGATFERHRRGMSLAQGVSPGIKMVGWVSAPRVTHQGTGEAPNE